MLRSKRNNKRFVSTALIIIILLIAGFANAGTSDDKEAIYKAGLNYIEGFYEGDSSKLKTSLSPKLKKFGYWKDEKTGKFSKANWMKYEEALAYADEVKKKGNFAKPDAPKKVEVIDYTTKIAAVKISAWWGVDYMLLSKHDGNWMIEEVIWEGPSLEAKATDDDRMAVKRATLNYLEGFYEGDSSKLKASLNPKMFKFGYSLDKKTSTHKPGKQMTFEQAIGLADKIKENKWFPKPDDPREVEVLEVKSIIAISKVTASWGIDYILLAKTGDVWKIEQILWAGVSAA